MLRAVVSILCRVFSGTLFQPRENRGRYCLGRAFSCRFRSGALYGAPLMQS